MKNLCVLFFLTIGTLVSAQSYKIGVRAGANYSQFRGPVESEINEEFNLSGGFHFGFNFTYYVLQPVGLRIELLYLQTGTKQKIGGDSYTLVRIPNSSAFLKEEGYREQNMDISNAYISLPVSVQIQLNKKFELFGGFYTNFLIGPTGGGRVCFDSTGSRCTREIGTNEDGFFYRQSLLHDYNSDFAGQAKDANINPVIIVDDVEITIPGSIGAYYFENEEVTDSYINSLDLGVFAGVNYFVNRGFYLGGRVVYGLRDITNVKYDYSLVRLDENNNFIQRNDNDQLIGFEISLGFRF